jgi:hypothetical protein
MKREIINITYHEETEDYYTTIIALCLDGTVWLSCQDEENDRNAWSPWIQLKLPPIPDSPQ